MPLTEEDLIRITARLAERKGWRKQKMLGGTAHEGAYWVTGPENCPKLECPVLSYRPTEDLNQAEKELQQTRDVAVLHYEDGIWYIYPNAHDFDYHWAYQEYLSKHESLAIAICMALVGWSDELQAMTK